MSKKKELKFTKEQEQRRQVVHDATLDYCKVLTEDNNLGLDQEVIDHTIEFMSERLSNRGYSYSLSGYCISQ